MSALKALDLGNMDENERREWLADARLNAILGCCKKTLASLHSGVRAYVAFACALLTDTFVSVLLSLSGCALLSSFDGTLRPYFPPKLDVLLAWSNLFRCDGTWQNYKGYVRTACLALGVDTQV